MNFLSKPPKEKRLICASEMQTERWTPALRKAGLAQECDPNYRRLMSLIPTGHVSRPDNGWFYYSEEFIDAILTNPEFFKAWTRIME